MDTDEYNHSDSDSSDEGGRTVGKSKHKDARRKQAKFERRLMGVIGKVSTHHTEPELHLASYQSSKLCSGFTTGCASL